MESVSSPEAERTAPLSTKAKHSRPRTTLPQHPEFPYAYFRGDQLPFSGIFSEHQLVWVCKSKGRKRRRRNREEYLSSTEDSQQRLELFLRARVDSLDAEPDDRLRVRYPKGSTYAVKRDHLLPVLEEEHNLVLVLPETDVYRRCCVVHTLPEESFLEIGCESGLTCHRVQQAKDNPAVPVVGVDKSSTSIDRARARFPELQLHCWDFLAHEPPTDLTVLPDVVAVDINGNRELPAVLECLEAIWKLWQPRLLIVKSRSLYAELQQE